MNKIKAPCKKEPVNIFFACDAKYMAYTAVTIASIKKNSSLDRDFLIKILHTGIEEERKTALCSEFSEPRFQIEFCDISPSLESISELLHTRDYYTKTTYYRIFIPTLFPNIRKALYLDSDIVVTGDVGDLYDTDIGCALVGAVRDEFVYSNKILAEYAKNRLGLSSASKYFNAGVLIMNLERMREIRFLEVFTRLISEVKFDVAQDQDYLNVICKGRVKYLGYEWNFMPLEGASEPRDGVSLVHYNLDNKPWQRGGILYDELFWELALCSALSDEISGARDAYTEHDIRKSRKETEKLIAAAGVQASDAETNLIISKKIAAILSEFSL